MQFERRADVSMPALVVAPFAAIAVALVLCAGLIAAAGVNPLTAYAEMLKGALGSRLSITETLTRAVPLIFTGLAAAVAFRARVWNIGAEGQLFLGAFFATGVALHLLPAETPTPVMLTAMAVAGFIGGALWGVIPGILKAKLNVNEIITTLMLNYVAILWNNFFIYGAWSERGFGLTPQFPRTAWLPRFTDFADSFPMFRGMTAHFGIFIAVAVAVILWVVWQRTRWGFEVTVVGDNPRAARYAGINLTRNIILVMLGFTAIIVCFVGRLNPLGIVAAGVLLSLMLIGGELAQSRLGLPNAMASVLQGLLLLILLGCDTFIEQRLRWSRPARHGA